MKILYKILGLFFVGLGFLGAFLPVLPTTPFLLLSLWFFSRSSEKLKNWVLTNRLFGSYISNYYNGQGIPKRIKYYILILLLGAISCSAWAVRDKARLVVLLMVIATCVSIHIVRIKPKKPTPVEMPVTDDRDERI